MARFDPRVLAAIALGGMLGATARFEVADALPVVAGEFPWATFWTNVSGSFVLGFLLIVVVERVTDRPLLRPFLTTGILGAYTTMSTFLVEVAVLAKDGHVLVAGGYAVASLTVGLGLAWAGMAAGRRVVP